MGTSGHTHNFFLANATAAPHHICKNPLAAMLPQRLKLLRQNRRRKTIEWKKHLDRRLLLQEVCDAGSHIRDATSATLTAWSPYIINCLSLTSEAVTRCSSQLSVISMVTALLCCAVQFCCLSGALQGMFRKDASFQVTFCFVFVKNQLSQTLHFSDQKPPGLKV